MYEKLDIETISKTSITDLGSGLTVRTVSNNGTDEKLFYVSIPMTDEEFKDEGKNGFCALQGIYERLNTHVPSLFAQFRGAYTVDDFAVYVFATSNDWICLHEIENQRATKLALPIYKKLVEIINKYQNCNINAHDYHSLMMICNHSVLLSLNSDDTLKDLCLLPLPVLMSNHYRGFPCKLDLECDSVGDDLFMASYLYLSLKYRNGEPFVEDDAYKLDCLAEQCLSLFHQRRPSLTAVIDAMNNMDSTSPPKKNADTKSESKTNSTDSYKVYIEEEDVNFDDRGIGVSKESGFKIHMKRIINKIKKVFKWFSKHFLRIKNYFDKALSTEKGDRYPDDE